MMEKGYLLDKRYLLIRPIGEGGMANVYLAHDQKNDQDVAVKILHMDLQNDPNTKKRFQREASASSKLNHPNIVKVYNIGEDAGMSYIVMEYVTGMDLKHYIDQNFPIPYRKVIDIMKQILSAVQAAHDHDIIHRDLKPQNIMIDKNDHIKIADFGIAVALHDNSLTQTNTLLGSVHYLSPEQAKGSMATKQSDIYALGIILYEMLTGKVPFEGESAVSIAIKHFQDEIPSVQALDPRIPQPLENVVLHATAKDPHDRYKSAAEMAVDLSTSLDKKRANEPKFVPNSNSDLDETKVIQIPKNPDLADKVVPNKHEEQLKADKKWWTFLKKRRFWMAFGLALLVFILAVGFIIGTTKKNVEIPDLTGMSETQAKSVLTDNHLKIGDISHQYDNDVQKDRVIRSYPKKNMVVKEQSKVNLLISQGPKKIRIGNYVGQNYTQIRKKLMKLGFTVRKNETSSTKYAAGQIMNQDVPEGKKVIPQETIITLTVSSGRAFFNLRDLTNYTQKSVQDYANEKGLVLNITSQYSDTVEKGLVISQTPAAGTRLSKGSSLNVVISLGEKNKAPEQVSFNKTITIPFNPKTATQVNTADIANPNDNGVTASSSSSSASASTSTSSSTTTTPVHENHVTIFIQDETHNISDVYRQMVITQTTNVTLTFTVKGNESAYYKVVRDGDVILTDEVKPS
ncbi:Stk1 family PASTA domain-containing Ser/Thr kinase [Agrilactobacillus fermenti]|uniref:Stk1 family PASTA domain-containing Ser/Thr kinase n=1 Tax=Agrilactobacillus fermenti TaxID=2586909 RepID=UPI003A5BC580